MESQSKVNQSEVSQSWLVLHEPFIYKRLLCCEDQEAESCGFLHDGESESDLMNLGNTCFYGPEENNMD